MDLHQQLTVSLERELEVAKAYTQLMSLRFLIGLKLAGISRLNV